MKKTTTEEINFDLFSVMMNNRPEEFLETIEKYYVGKTESNIGNNHCSFKDGKLVNFRYGRDDVMVVQFMNVANCFIHPTEFISVDCWHGIELSEDEKIKMRNVCKTVIEKEKHYMKIQEKWYVDYEMISKKLNGKSPEEAVEILKEWIAKEK